MPLKPLTAVVLGELGLLRCLGEQGVPCLVVASDLEHLAFASRYCTEAIYVPNFEPSCQETLQTFLRLGERLQQSIIFCNGETDFLFVSHHRKILEQYFILNMPDEQQAQALVNKGLFYELAKKHNMPVPKTFAPKNARELDGAIKSISYPCILKPARQFFWQGTLFDTLFGAGTKAIQVHSPKELRQLYTVLHGIHPDLLIQEYVPGRDEQLYFVDIYLDRQSQPLDCFVGHRVRSFPIHAGLSTLAETVHRPDLVQSTLDCLVPMGYRGAAHVDFKVDERTNTAKLLEINPRFGLTIDMGARAGVNIPLIAYNDLANSGQSTATRGKPKKTPLKKPTYQLGVKWIDAKQDIKAFFKYQQIGEWKLAAWLQSFAGPRMYRVWDKNDPRPFFVSCSMIARKQSRRFLGRLRRKAGGTASSLLATQPAASAAPRRSHAS